MTFVQKRLILSGIALTVSVFSAFIFHAAPRIDATTQTEKDTLAAIVLVLGSFVAGVGAGSTLNIGND